jgi:hypothetical protein
MIADRTVRRLRRSGAAGALLVAAVGLVGHASPAGAAAVAGDGDRDGERVVSLWVLAEVADDGSAQVTEIIDYDFGSSVGRHGIVRSVPGLEPDALITADSDTAPDRLEVTRDAAGTTMRIGDPEETVSGRHRYRIDYPLPHLVEGDRIDWDAVDTEWDVGIDAAEIHLVAPYGLDEAECFAGATGSGAPCDDVHELAPGHLTATAGVLGARQGASLEVAIGERLTSRPAAPAVPWDGPALPPPPPTAPRPAASGGGDLSGLVFFWFAVLFIIVSFVATVARVVLGRGGGGWGTGRTWYGGGGGWSSGGGAGSGGGGGGGGGGDVGGGRGGGGGGSW